MEEFSPVPTVVDRLGVTQSLGTLITVVILVILMISGLRSTAKHGRLPYYITSILIVSVVFSSFGIGIEFIVQSYQHHYYAAQGGFYDPSIFQEDIGFFLYSIGGYLLTFSFGLLLALIVTITTMLRRPKSNNQTDVNAEIAKIDS